MPWYGTMYTDPLSGRRYGSSVWAPSRRTALKRCVERRLGEKLDGPIWADSRAPYPRPSTMMRQRGRLTIATRMRIVHATTFLCYLLHCSHQTAAYQTLGDDGVLHSLIHSLSLGYPHRAKMVRRLRLLEEMVPGYVRGR